MSLMFLMHCREVWHCIKVSGVQDCPNLSDECFVELALVCRLEKFLEKLFVGLHDSPLMVNHRPRPPIYNLFPKHVVHM